MRLQDVILRDDRASQPAAAAVPIGALYYVTDEFVMERSTGAGWEDVSAAAGGGGAVWGAISGTLSSQGDLVTALGLKGAVASPLSQFAATTSAQLAGVISDETGSGLLVFDTSPTLVTPTIASFVNAGHTHLNAAGGGTITAAAISDLATAAVAFTNKTGAISQWTNDASFTTLAAVAGVGYLTSVGTINLASGVTGTLPVANGGTGVTASTGTVAVVLSTSPTLVTPLLGTPTSGVLTNCTGTAAGLTAGTVTTNANLTGPITSSGNATAIASQTGTGTKFVVDTSPTLVTPILGVAAATSVAATSFLSSTQTIAAVSTDGLILTNTTAAAAGAQQWSPRLRWTGQGWKTTATAASQTVDWIAEVQPVEGTTTPTSNLTWASQVNGGGYLTRARFNSAGGLYLTDGSTGALGLTLGTNTIGWYGASNSWTFFASTSVISIFSSVIRMNSATPFGWSASDSTAGADTLLSRDAARSLALRDGTNAQKFRIYNTFTTVATAGEWWKQDWQTTANQFRMGAVKGSSTGTAREATWDYGGVEATPTAAITVPITSGVITFGGPILLPATTTSLASLNLPHGTAPSSPVNGDIWTTTAGLYVRINGATVGPLS